MSATAGGWLGGTVHDASTSERIVTGGEQMLAMKRRRETCSEPFCRGGVHLFFYSGAACPLIALGLCICSLTGENMLPTARDPLAWHEMLFGFFWAVIGGLLLIARSELDGPSPDRGLAVGWPARVVGGGATGLALRDGRLMLRRPRGSL